MADKGAVPAKPIPGADAPAKPAKATPAAAKMPVEEEVPVPLPVLVAAEQPPIPVTIVAADGVTPVPIPALGIEANTPPPGPQATPAPQPAATGTPVNVTVMAPAPVAATAVKGEGTTLAPTTTEQQDVVTEGQRRVNLIWEAVQATIAIAVTFAIIYLAIVQTPAETITNAFFLIVGFYFSRVNHESTGGTGPKPPQFPYTGR